MAAASTAFTATRLEPSLIKLVVAQELPGTSYEDYTSVDIVKRVMEITGGDGCKAVSAVAARSRAHQLGLQQIVHLFYAPAGHRWHRQVDG